MEQAFCPVFTTRYDIADAKTVFFAIDDDVVVEAPGALMRALVRLCDGTRSRDEIVAELMREWHHSSVRDLIGGLIGSGILADSRSLSDVNWKVVENPFLFRPTITEAETRRLELRAQRRNKERGSVYQASPSSFGVLLTQRRSTRTFSTKSVELRHVVNMAWSAYGLLGDAGNSGVRTVPSAGQLYPLVIHVVLLRPAGELAAGIYRISTGGNRTVGFDLVSDEVDLYVRSLVDPMTLLHAHGAVIVSGSFQTVSQKYGNRSLLYVTLEAGHVAQNVYLAATEVGVATVEVGGFYDVLLAEAIRLPREFHPLTTILFGIEDSVPRPDPLASHVKVDWAAPLAGEYRLPFTLAFARMEQKTGEDDWSSGKSTDPQLARVKALAEAREWAACEYVPNTARRARWGELEGMIDPRRVVRFHPAQYRVKEFPLTPFNERARYDWVPGVDEFTGSVVHVLADHVYISSPVSGTYAQASSSGVAAHPDRAQAVKNGVLELVERDSFMIAYLSGIQRPTIAYSSLPAGVQKRIRALRKVGFKVWVKDYTLDLAPVIFIFVQNEELSYTMCAACSDFDREEALDHALMEIESAVLIRLTNGPLHPIEVSEIKTPEGHGALYEQKRHFRKANFLVRTRESVAFQDVGQGSATSWQELLDRFTARGWPLITVPLVLSAEAGGNAGLHIVRSIVPGIVPISFGYRREPCGMERIQDVAARIGGITLSYAGMPKFPHPYT